MKTHIYIVVLDGLFASHQDCLLNDIYCDLNKLEILIFFWFLKIISFAFFFKEKGQVFKAIILEVFTKKLTRRNMFKQAFISDLISSLFFVRIVC